MAVSLAGKMQGRMKWQSSWVSQPPKHQGNEPENGSTLSHRQANKKHMFNILTHIHFRFCKKNNIYRQQKDVLFKSKEVHLSINRQQTPCIALIPKHQALMMNPYQLLLMVLYGHTKVMTCSLKSFRRTEHLTIKTTHALLLISGRMAKNMTQVSYSKSSLFLRK